MTTDTFDKLERNMDEFQKEADKLKAQMTEIGKANFTKVAKELFDKHPLLVAITWTQYTPYFNDGDECIFGVQEPEYTVLKSDIENNVDSDEWTGRKPSEWQYEPKNYVHYKNEIEAYNKLVAEHGTEVLKALEDDMERFFKFIQSYDDLMKALFGDHAIIHIDANGVSVEEYEHD